MAGYYGDGLRGFAKRQRQNGVAVAFAGRAVEQASDAALRVRSVLGAQFGQRTEVGRALNRLQAVRQQSSRMALMTAPAPAIKGDLFVEEHVTVVPGSYLSREVDGFNPGAGRVRMALVAPLAECVEAAGRIRDFIQRRR